MHQAILGGILLAAASLGTSADADTTILDDFVETASERWEYLADVVMGGVSDGGAEFVLDNGTDFVRLTGSVSPQSNGGFLRVRRLLPQGLPKETVGLELDVRGNGEVYYVFLRTNEVTRPRHFYSAPFQSTAEWSTVRLPLAEFERSESFLADPMDPKSVASIGLVACGRDHIADLSVATIGLY